MHRKSQSAFAKPQSHRVLSTNPKGWLNTSEVQITFSLRCCHLEGQKKGRDLKDSPVINPLSSSYLFIIAPEMRKSNLKLRLHTHEHFSRTKRAFHMSQYFVLFRDARSIRIPCPTNHPNTQRCWPSPGRQLCPGCFHPRHKAYTCCPTSTYRPCIGLGFIAFLWKFSSVLNLPLFKC